MFPARILCFCFAALLALAAHRTQAEENDADILRRNREAVWKCLEKGQEANLLTKRCYEKKDRNKPGNRPEKYWAHSISKETVCGKEAARLSDAERAAREARLDPAFITEILSNKSKADGIRGPEIRISGAVLCFDLRLEGIQTRRGLVLDRSYFGESLHMGNTTIGGNLSFDDSHFFGTIAIRQSRIDGDMFLGNAFFYKLLIRDTDIKGIFSATNMTSFYQVVIRRSDIGGVLTFRNARLTSLRIAGTHVEEELTLASSEVRCAVRISNAEVRHIEGKNIKFGSAPSASEGSRWTKPLPPAMPQPARDRLRERSRENLVAGRHEAACGLSQRRKADRGFSLEHSTVEGNLELTLKREETVPVRLEHVRIGGVARFVWPPGAVRKKEANVDLIRVDADAIATRLDCWPKLRRIDRLTYNVLVRDKDSKSCSGGSTSPERDDFSDIEVIRWLRTTGANSIGYTTAINAFVKDGRNTTQLKIAKSEYLFALLRQDHAAKSCELIATHCGYDPGGTAPENTEQQEAHADAAEYGYGSLFLDTVKLEAYRLYGWLIDYGHRPLKIVYWIVIAVAAFRFVLWWRASHIETYNVKTDGDNSVTIKPGLFYALDMFIPVIKLRNAHYEFELKDTVARRILYGYRVLGYVFTGFVLAGLSGLTHS